MSVIANAYAAPYAGFTPKSAGSGSAATMATAAASRDSTKVSDLAQALTGRAAALFGHMDAKMRGTLETMVRSGQVTAKDVVLGLEEMAKQAEFNRSIKENPLTAAEQARGAELQAMREGVTFGKDSAFSSVSQSTAEQMDGLQRAYEAGQISQEELDKGLKAAREQLQEGIEKHLKPQIEKLSIYGPAVAEQINSVLGRKVSEYKAALASRSTDGTAEEISTEEGHKALDKLYSHGLLSLGHKALRTAAEAYARQADVAGLGPATGATPAPITPALTTAPPPAPVAAQTEAGGPDWATALLSPKQQAGLELLRQAAESDKTDKPGQEKGFWAAKYLLADLSKG